MKLKLSTNSVKNVANKPSKCLKRKRKDLENEIKELLIKSQISQNCCQTERNNNKELVEKNVCLLAENEALKREKLDLFERFMFRQNGNHLMVNKSQLMVLFESLRSDRKDILKMRSQLKQMANDFFTKIVETFDKMDQKIDKIDENIQKVVEYEDNPKECDSLNESIESSDKKGAKSQEIYEMRQMSRQSGQQNNCIESHDLSLSVIPEVTQEISNQTTNTTHYQSIGSRFQTPIRKSQNLSTNYELSPQFSASYIRTPSIYNFDGRSSFDALKYSLNDERSYLTHDQSLRPDFNFSFETTVTEEQNGMTASTPVYGTRLSTTEMIQRPSKRLSSINRPFSPRLGRPSLLDIQNVMENNKKSRKQSIIRQTNEKIENQSNDSNCVNTTKKRRKKCDTTSFDSDMSETSANSSLSSRSSRRNRKPVSYKEPSLMGKLRRPSSQSTH